MSRLATFLANEDSDDEEGFRKLRGRHKCWWFGIEKRIRVYGRIFEAKRWPIASIYRARNRTFCFPLIAAGPAGFYIALGANSVSLTYRYFPSDEAQDVIRSVRAHGPLVCILLTIARLLPFGALCTVRPGRLVNDIVYAGAGLRAVVFLCSHHADSGDHILGNTDVAPPPPPPPPPPPA